MLTYKDGCFKSTEYFHIQSLTADLKACGNLIVVGRLGGQIFYFFLLTASHRQGAQH